MSDATELRTCLRCGATVPGEASYCLHCGERQDGEDEVSGDGRLSERDLEAALRRALAPQYQLVRRIGKGGMGSVFLARDPTLKRSVAVKVLSPELSADETARFRFQREAQAVAALSHPNVVAIHSVGELEDGIPYFVMQHVDGGNLEERLEREGPLEVGEAKRILGQVASALAAAHGKGIIHRDVKPSNVLYDHDSGRVLVSDFGIAAIQATAEVAEPEQLTRTGTFVGTPEYMSPEQLLGEAVTERTDIYSLGLLAYALLTGEGPYDAASPQMMFAAHLRDEPRDLGELRRDVGPELREIARASLAKDPAERPTAADLVRRLEPEEGGLLEWPPPALERLQGRSRQPALLLLIGGLAAVTPSLAAIDVGTAAAVGSTSFGQLVAIATGAVGLVLVGAGLVQLARALRLTRHAVRLGHAWGTVLEVLADGRGDTGAVIAGTREYTGLSQDERGTIRGERLVGAGALLLAGLLPLPAFVLMIALSSAGLIGPEIAFLVVLGPPALLLIAAFVVRWRESRRVRERRTAMKWRGRLDETTRRLVPAWYASYREVAGEGQPGPGPKGWAGAGVVAAWIVGALLVGAGLLALPVMNVTAGALQPFMGPASGAIEERVREAAIARPYRLDPDSGLSPGEAGALLIQLMGVPATSSEAGSEIVRVPDRTLPPFSYPAACDRAFGDDFPAGQPEIYEKAAEGFSSDERECLGSVPNHPGLEILATVARAPALDFEGAYLAFPVPEDVAPHALPIPTFRGLRELTYAAVAWSALATVDGQWQEAEETLRAVISVGLLLIDDSRFPIGSLIGAVITGLAVQGLESHYRMTGRVEEAARIAAARDSVSGLAETLNLEGERSGSVGRPLDPQSLRAATLATLADETKLRSTRWDMLFNMVVFPCTNARELLFGPAPDLEDAWAHAREDLVRIPSDAELFRVMEEGLTRLARTTPDRFPVRVARALGAAVGNPRIQGCMVVAGM